jgi:hypothetical protein
VDVVDPATELFRVTQGRISQRLELYIIVKRGAAVLTWENIFQEFEPFFDRGFVFYWICGD